MKRTFLLVATLAAFSAVALPGAARAQKALVYCAPSDPGPCNNVVAALSASGSGFAEVDRGYDGVEKVGGVLTKDIADPAVVGGYSVFFVPSYNGNPYAHLRNPAVQSQLAKVLKGRVAVWSGYPDHGTADIPQKGVLIRNLANWAKSGPGSLPGVVALLDLSTDATRFAWLTPTAGVTVTASHATRITPVSPWGKISFVNAGPITTGITVSKEQPYDDAVAVGLTPVSPAPADRPYATVSGDGAMLITFLRTPPIACTAPSITAPPEGATKMVGEKVTFSVTAAGTGVTYQWKKNGMAIAGATASTYTIASVKTVDAGDYTVVVSACNASVTSDPAKLTVDKATANVSLTASSLNHDYDGTAKSAQATTDALGPSSLEITYDGSTTPPTAAGKYTVVATLESADYFGTASATMVIAKAPLAVNANDATTTFGAAPTLGYTLSGFVTGENAEKVAIGGAANCSVVSGTPSNAGTYPEAIVCTAGTLNADNYSFSGGSKGTLTINAADVSIKIKDASRAFGEPNPPFEIESATGVANAAELQCMLTSAADASSPASSTHDITATCANQNYAVAITKGTLTITKAQVTFTISGTSHTYDGTPKKVSVTADPDVTPLIEYRDAAKNVVDSPTGAGTYGVTVTSGDPNYEGTKTGTLEIAPKAITGSFTADDKVYDGTTAAAITSRALAGTIDGDDVRLTGGTATFADKHVGPNKTVTGTGFALGGTASGNYTLASATLTTTASITPRVLAITVTAKDKEYDSSTAAEVTLSDNRVSGDVFTLGYSSAVFADKNVGSGKPVTVSGIAASGSDAGNYTVAETATAQASITKRTASVTPNAAGKVYGDDDPTLGGTLDKFLTEDNVQATYSRTSGETVKGGPYTISATLSPADVLGNYDITYNTADFTITARPITVTADAQTKVYGEDDPALTQKVTRGNLMRGDQLSGALERAAGSNVGSYAITKGSLTAGDDYDLTFIGASLTITAKELTGGFTADDKVYDGTTAAAITSRALAGTIDGDDVRLTGGTATFADKHVGPNKTVTGTGFALGGTASGNYTLASATLTTTAAISPRTLNVTATGVDKVYDGSKGASVTLLTNDRVSGDDLTLGYSAAFDDKTVGTGKTVTVSGITISGGADAGNYTLGTTTTTATANITAKPLTGSFTVSNKVFDGTTTATVLTRSLDGVVDGDVVSLTGGTATFDNAAVGAKKVVTLTGATLTGADAHNYTFVVNTAIASIGSWTAEGFHNPVTKNTSFTKDPGADGKPQALPLADDNTVWNTAKGGSTIPLKFTVFAGAAEVTSTEGIVITKTQLACKVTNNEETILQTSGIDNTGATDLRYTGGQFIQNWQTPKVPDESCYRVAATLRDNSVIYTFVKLKK
jgi:hypothetical protein